MPPRRLPPAGTAVLALCCLYTQKNRSPKRSRMITQIQRWRRFFAELAGSSPEAEFETDKGWSIVVFFSNVRIQNIRIVYNIFSHAKWHVEATIYRPGMRCAGSAKARSTACFASGSGTERRGLNKKPHNSPFLAHAWYFDGRIHPANSCNRRFPLPLHASSSTSLPRVRAGRVELPTDLPDELLNSVSIGLCRSVSDPYP